MGCLLLHQNTDVSQDSHRPQTEDCLGTSTVKHLRIQSCIYCCCICDIRNDLAKGVFKVTHTYCGPYLTSRWWTNVHPHSPPRELHVPPIQRNKKEITSILCFSIPRGHKKEVVYSPEILVEPWRHKQPISLIKCYG